MHWWACFSPRKESRPNLAEPFRAAAVRHDAGPGVRSKPKVGRNAPCPCGSGKKYKRCCGR
jgi:preprotein translocase subunit SecA